MAIRQRKQISRVVRFNEQAVARSLYKRNPQKYNMRIKTTAGYATQLNTTRLRQDVQKLRKKAAVAKSRQLKQFDKANKPINAKLVTAPATLVKSPSSSSGSVGSSVSGSQDRSNLRRLGAVAVGDRAYRQRVLTAPKALRNLGTYKFGN